MTRNLLAAALMTLVLVAPARAAQSDNLQMFRSVQKKVLQYSYFTVFDSVSAQVNGGAITLVGKVTMPYKKNDIEKRVAKLPGVTSVDNRIEVLPVSQFDDELRVRIARAIYGNSMFYGYGSMV